MQFFLLKKINFFKFRNVLLQNKKNIIIEKAKTLSVVDNLLLVIDPFLSIHLKKK